MTTGKDWIKMIVATVLTVLITLTVTGAFNYPQKIENKFVEVETNANNYTDKQIQNHELKETERFKRYEENMTETKKMVQFLYERELNKIK
jgi:hypothetical protein